MALTKVTHNVLESRYTAASALSSAAAVTVDSSAANVFTITAGHNITFNFTNVKIGDVKTIISKIILELNESSCSNVKFVVNFKVVKPTIAVPADVLPE